MLRQSADARATALDFSQVLPQFLARASALGLSERVDTLAADYHEADLARKFERVVLANVLHLEDQRGAARLIEKATSALLTAGDLVIVDVLDCLGQDSAYATYCLHLAMRTQSGVAHPSAAIAGWLRKAGFSKLRVVDLSSELPALGALIAERS